MEQEETKPKKYGSNNIYIDAAVEALQQARKENGKLSYMLVVVDGNDCGVSTHGNVFDLACAIAYHAKQNNNMLSVVKAVDTIIRNVPDLGKDTK